MKVWEKIIQYGNLIQAWFGNLTDVKKRQFILICTGVFAFVLTLSVIISMTGKGIEEISGGPDRIMINSPIPAGELFLPDEPDFIPGVILSRERRTSWTADDALEHWHDPLRFGEEQWREKIEASIDELLERVP